MKLHQPSMLGRGLFNLAAFCLCSAVSVAVFPRHSVGALLVLWIGALLNLIMAIGTIAAAFTPRKVEANKTCNCSSMYCSERPENWPQ